MGADALETAPGPIRDMNPTPAALFLGIDTGGTYTDAVLWSEARRRASPPRPRR